MLYHIIPCYTMLYHVIPCHTMFYHVIPLPILFLQFHPFPPKPCNLSHSAAYLIIALLIISIYHTMSNHVIPCYTMLYHVIPSHTMFYHVIPLPILFLQFHPFPPKPCKLSHSPADLILAQFDLHSSQTWRLLTPLSHLCHICRPSALCWVPPYKRLSHLWAAARNIWRGIWGGDITDQHRPSSLDNTDLLSSQLGHIHSHRAASTHYPCHSLDMYTLTIY